MNNCNFVLQQKVDKRGRLIGQGEINTVRHSILKMKGFSLLGFLAISLIVLFHIDVSIATPWKSETTNTTMLNLNMWDEQEFSLDSHFGRILYDVSQSVTGKTSNRGQPASNCPRVQNYRSCLPNPNGGGPRQRCGDYTRRC